MKLEGQDSAVLVYEKKIMQFKADIEYSPEQIEFIRKQLNLY